MASPSMMNMLSPTLWNGRPSAGVGFFHARMPCRTKKL